MNLDTLRKQLEIDEGIKHDIYLDHLGLPTFGIGHLITNADPESGQEESVHQFYRMMLYVLVSQF